MFLPFSIEKFYFISCGEKEQDKQETSFYTKKLMFFSFSFFSFILFILFVYFFFEQMEDIELGKLIGAGSFGKVAEGKVC